LWDIWLRERSGDDGRMVGWQDDRLSFDLSYVIPSVGSVEGAGGGIDGDVKMLEGSI
jgi:hypothetical protein